MLLVSCASCIQGTLLYTISTSTLSIVRYILVHRCMYTMGDAHHSSYFTTPIMGTRRSEVWHCSKAMRFIEKVLPQHTAKGFLQPWSAHKSTSHRLCFKTPKDSCRLFRTLFFMPNFVFIQFYQVSFEIDSMDAIYRARATFPILLLYLAVFAYFLLC